MTRTSSNVTWDVEKYQWPEDIVVDNKSEPTTLRIGKYELIQDKDRLWLMRKGKVFDSEGVEVDQEDFEALIDEYYKKNF